VQLAKVTTGKPRVYFHFEAFQKPRHWYFCLAFTFPETSTQAQGAGHVSLNYLCLDICGVDGALSWWQFLSIPFKIALVTILSCTEVIKGPDISLKITSKRKRGKLRFHIGSAHLWDGDGKCLPCWECFQWDRALPIRCQSSESPNNPQAKEMRQVESVHLAFHVPGVPNQFFYQLSRKPFGKPNYVSLELCIHSSVSSLVWITRRCDVFQSTVDAVLFPQSLRFVMDFMLRCTV